MDIVDRLLYVITNTIKGDNKRHSPKKTKKYSNLLKKQRKLTEIKETIEENIPTQSSIIRESKTSL